MKHTHPSSSRPSSYLRHLPLAGLSLFMMFLLLCSTASAQLAGKGALTGKVADPTGAAIPDAVVVVTSNNTGVSTTTRSTGAGDYNLPTLDPGVYTVTITAPGFQKQT